MLMVNLWLDISGVIVSEVSVVSFVIYCQTTSTMIAVRLNHNLAILFFHDTEVHNLLFEAEL